ncbi:restriction endonuclease subunit S [Streptomyces sp. NPDC005499]|uniref:restriction endonuclease subunit S n=1 Tax=Streptomyces sp. NPDC005499 TaxID=3154883 RepID=UPI0033B29084
MSDWQRTTLGQVMTQVSRAVRVKDLTEARYAGVRWYAGGVYDRETVPAEKIKGTTLYRIERDDIVYNRMWATKASFGVVKDEVDGCFVTNDFPAFTVNPEAILPEYVEAIFHTASFQSEAVGRAVGTTERRRLHARDFMNIAVVLPPLPIQERIVEVISAVDDQIAALAAEVEAVVKVRRGLVGRSADTAQVPLASLGVVSQGKGLPKEFQGKRTGTVSWYKIADMTGPGNKFGYTLADTRLTPSEVAEIGGVVAEPGAVTFPRVGAAVLTEKKRIVDTAGALDENHLIITPAQGTNSEYLLTVMDNFALSGLVRPGAVPSLNMGLIRSTQVPWSWTENQSIGAALGALRAESRALAAEAASLRTTRAVLVSALLDRTIDIESAELEV